MKFLTMEWGDDGEKSLSRTTWTWFDMQGRSTLPDGQSKSYGPMSDLDAEDFAREMNTATVPNDQYRVGTTAVIDFYRRVRLAVREYAELQAQTS